MKNSQRPEFDNEQKALAPQKSFVADMEDHGDVLAFSRSKRLHRVAAGVFAGVFWVLTIVFVAMGAMAVFCALWLILAAPLTVLALGFHSAMQVDRKKKAVIDWWRIFGWRREKVTPLSEFDTIKLEYDVHTNDGSSRVSYHAVLRGPENAIKLFSSGYEEQAADAVKQVAEFLDWPGNLEVEPFLNPNATRNLIIGIILMLAFPLVALVVFLVFRGFFY